MSNIAKAQHAFDKCKINLLSINGSPFLATILFGMKHKFCTSVPTLATTGLELIINPDFFVSIPEKQREAEIAHECWHVALDHISRLYTRTHKKWNYATDYAINIMMKDSGKYQLGNDWLLDEKYRGMTADNIYDMLPDIPDDDDGPNHVHKPKDGDGNTMTQSSVTSQIQQLVAKAAMIAQQKNEGFGYVPGGGIEFLLSPILKPKLSWKILLQNYVSTFAKEDYSYKRPNRRYLPDIYMPTLYSEACGEIGTAFDASCSVSDEDFRIMLGQLHQIHRTLRPSISRLVTFDTQIQNEYKMTGYTNLNKLKFNGRGGTDVHCVFEHFKKIRPKVLVIFTDMDFKMPTEKPNYPVIWVGVNVPSYLKDIKVPFGRYIEFTG